MPNAMPIATASDARKGAGTPGRGSSTKQETLTPHQITLANGKGASAPFVQKTEALNRVSP